MEKTVWSPEKKPPMPDRLQQRTARYAELLSTLDESIDQGPWDKSLFLTAVGKKLEKLRQELRCALDGEAVLDPAQDEEQASKVSELKPEEETVQAYVSLYCANGDQFDRWEPLLANLSYSSLSRPLYPNQDHVRAMIKTKTKPENEAYCLVELKAKELIKGKKDLHDRMGHPLLILKQGSIHPSQIRSFYHQSNEYSWQDGRLVKRSP